jgi:CTP:phosphocholine cytidylyltransferase-like protein/thiamine kinase-like enzyme
VAEVRNAIILSAGIGERAVPMTYETPKGLLKVFGEPMIERQIAQLREKGIDDITIVVGYMRERFEYLADEYGCLLVFNPEYAAKNNLASLYLVRDRLSSTYVCVSDNYMEENIFAGSEPHSWFSAPFYKGSTTEWIVSDLSAEGIIREIAIGGEHAHAVQGPAYFSPEFSEAFRSYLEEYYERQDSADYYWEQILKDEIANLPPMYIKDTTGVFHEFENLEELRDYDRTYLTETENSVMRKIAGIFGVAQGEIHSIEALEAGMSNRSFRFKVKGMQYVFRLAGSDTNKLVNRRTECEIYELLQPYGITDRVVYFNPESGTKISEYYENGRAANPYDDGDLKSAMSMIRQVHELKLQADVGDDIESVIYRYQQMADEAGAEHFDGFDELYTKVKSLFARQSGAPGEVSERHLIHGDFHHENMLVSPDGTARIIDWEYAKVGDPWLDVGFFGVFAGFDKERSDFALKEYLGYEPSSADYDRYYRCCAVRAFFELSWAMVKVAGGAEFKNYRNDMYLAAKYYCELLEKQK